MFGIEGGWKPCREGKDPGGPGVGISPLPAPGPASNPRFAPILGCNFPRGVAFAPVAIFDVLKWLRSGQTATHSGIILFLLGKSPTRLHRGQYEQRFSQNGAQRNITKVGLRVERNVETWDEPSQCTPFLLVKSSDIILEGDWFTAQLGCCI